MSKISDLRESLVDLTKQTSVYNKGSSLIPKADYQEIDSRIKPVERGRERGAADLPPLGTKTPDEVELQILNTYQEMLNDTAEQAGERLGDYNQRILSLELSSKLDQIRDTCRSAIADFRTAIHRETTDLEQSFQAVGIKRRDLELFKAANNVDRSAQYPDHSGRLWRWVIVLAMFLIETFATATFLAKGNEAGWIGAYGEAISFALLNIGIALLVGIMIARRLNSIHLSQRCLAALAIALAGGVAILLNLTLAHYRELSGSELFIEAGTAAISRLVEDPLHIESVQSWILFGMGCLFWVIALVDGYGLDDPIPGYGKYDRAHVEAQSKFAELKRDCIEDLEERRGSGESDVTSFRAELSERQSQINALFNLRSTLKGEWGKFADQCQAQAEQMILAYRDANRNSRNRSPASFNKTLSLTVPPLGNDTLSISIESIESQISEGRSKLDEAHDTFYSEYDSAVAKFSLIDKASREPVQTISEESSMISASFASEAS